MIRVGLQIKDTLTPVTRRIQRELKRYPQQAESEYRSLTPIASGNARRNTRLVNNDTIEANYPYAQVLDRGRHLTPRGMRGSKQAPSGMTKPFLAWARRRIAEIFRK